jgi:hypothetical protein
MKIYLTSLFLALAAGGCCTGHHQGYSARRLDSKAISEAQILRISAEVDGSGFFEFTPVSASYHHLNWQAPAAVTLDGEPWTNLDETPPGWADNGPRLDLSRAQIVERKGRDVIALERTEAGFDLYLGDTPNGSDRYEVTIAIPRRK